MATRLDELHGHQYTTQRIVNALTRHDADPTGPARPRSLTLALVSASIAALLLVGTLVFNALTGQGTPSDLRDSSTVLIEKETGAQYVYTKADDQLHPVLNYASGLLLAEGAGGAPTTVRRSRLASLRRDSTVQIGAVLGIPDAPNALPRPGDLVHDPWHVCTIAAPGGTTGPRTGLLVTANSVSGGHTLVTPESGGAAEALLVQAPDQRVYLVFANRKFLLPEPSVVLTAFGWTGRPRQPVAAGWLNALATGPDIRTPEIVGLGEQSRAVPAPIGRLYQASGSDQWAVVRRDDVLSISYVEARLLQTGSRTGLPDPVKVSLAEFAALRLTSPAPSTMPKVVPTLLSIASTACVRVPDAATGVTAVVVDPSPSAAPAQGGRVAPRGGRRSGDRPVRARRPGARRRIADGAEREWHRLYRHRQRRALSDRRPRCEHQTRLRREHAAEHARGAGRAAAARSGAEHGGSPARRVKRLPVGRALSTAAALHAG